MKKLLTILGILGVTLIATPYIHATSSVPVAIISITPDKGPVGTEVILKGVFSEKNSRLNFAGVKNVMIDLEAEHTQNKEQIIKIVIPATPCEYGLACDMVVTSPGRYPLSITDENGFTSNIVFFTITPFSSTPTSPESVEWAAPTEPTLVFVEIVSAHTNSPIPNTSVTVRGSKLYNKTLSTNGEGMIKLSVPADITVNQIIVEAPEYKTEKITGSKLTAVLDGQSRVSLSLINPPPPPAYDPLHPPEEGTTVPRTVPNESLWGRIMSLFRTLFSRR